MGHILSYILVFEYSNNQIKTPLFVFMNKSVNCFQIAEFFNAFIRIILG